MKTKLKHISSAYIGIIFFVIFAVYCNAQDFTISDYVDAETVSSTQYKGIFTAKLLHLYYTNCNYFDYPKDFQNLASTYKQSLQDLITASGISESLCNTDSTPVSKEEIRVYFSRISVSSLNLHANKYIELITAALLKKTDFSKKIETLLNRESGTFFDIFEISVIPKDETSIILPHNSLYLISNCKSNDLYDILYTIFERKYSYTTILPKMITMSKQERLTFHELFGYDFLFPEFEHILKHYFVLYSISSIVNKINEYTGITIEDKLEAHSFIIKTSAFNAIIKLWDSYNDTSFFKFPKKYGQIALDFIVKLKPEEIYQYKSSPQQLLSVQNDLTAVVTIDKAFGNEKNKLRKISSIFKRIGIFSAVSYDTYINNKKMYDTRKLFFVTIAYKKNAPELAAYFSAEYNDSIIINSLSFPAYDSICYFTVKEYPALLIVTSLPSIGYAYSQLENIKNIPSYVDVKKYTLFKKLLLFLNSII